MYLITRPIQPPLSELAGKTKPGFQIQPGVLAETHQLESRPVNRFWHLHTGVVLISNDSGSKVHRGCIKKLLC